MKSPAVIDLKVQYNIHKNPPLDPFPSQLNPVLRSKWSLTVGFSK